MGMFSASISHPWRRLRQVSLANASGYESVEKRNFKTNASGYDGNSLEKMADRFDKHATSIHIRYG